MKKILFFGVLPFMATFYSSQAYAQTSQAAVDTVIEMISDTSFKPHSLKRSSYNDRVVFHHGAVSYDLSIGHNGLLVHRYQTTDNTQTIITIRDEHNDGIFDSAKDHSDPSTQWSKRFATIKDSELSSPEWRALYARERKRQTPTLRMLWQSRLDEIYQDILEYKDIHT